MNAPIKYQPSYEQLEDDESKVTDELVETLRKIATTTYEDSGHALRGVHAKSHGLLRGELTVNAGLPPDLAQGMFATARAFPVILRMSTTPGDILDDDVSTPRGLALKVLGVEGERLPGSEQDTTQDFLMVDGPAFLKPNAKSFSRSLKLLAATTDKAEGLKKVLSAVLRGAEGLIERAGGESGTLKSLGGHPATHILGSTFFSQTPYLHGPYMAKLSIEPLSDNLRQLEGTILDLKDKPNALREAVAKFFEANDAEWQLRVQLCNDLEKMPIEDPSVAWPEALSPFIPVARIRVPRQRTWTEGESTREEDRLAFSPWHGLAAHRPLGSINRARREAYRSLATFRRTRNGCPMHEPVDKA